MVRAQYVPSGRSCAWPLPPSRIICHPQIPCAFQVSSKEPENTSATLRYTVSPHARRTQEGSFLFQL
jgi:hypothetical protein